jgi:hypothetical protein
MNMLDLSIMVHTINMELRKKHKNKTSSLMAAQIHRAAFFAFFVFI